MSNIIVEQVNTTSLDLALPNIKIFGVGGGGGNTLNYMILKGLKNVEFVAVNTDIQALDRSNANKKIQLGKNLTQGLGAGCNPDVGRRAADECRAEIKRALEGANIVFIAAGMGGGTGTGASPIIASIAKEVGALCFAVVSKPFNFEGRTHLINAEAGISELSKYVDGLIVVDNQQLLLSLGSTISIKDAFGAANDIIYNAVKGIQSLISSDAYIRIDLEDLINATKKRGYAIITVGHGKGHDLIQTAIDSAIHSPLVENTDIISASGILVLTFANPSFSLNKFAEINDRVMSLGFNDGLCKCGLCYDDSLDEDEVSVVMFIAGIQTTETSSANISNIVKNNSVNVNNQSRENNVNESIQRDDAKVFLKEKTKIEVNNPFARDFYEKDAADTKVRSEEIPLDSPNKKEDSVWSIPSIFRTRN